MELGIPIHMDKLIFNYDEKSKIYDRIIDCLNSGEKLAIPIESLRLYKKPITIDEIKKIDSSFSIPRCYLNIENYHDVYNLLLNRDTYEEEFINKHDNIYEDNIAMTCSEMEFTDDFIKKDEIYTFNDKYEDIKCGYINKMLK